MRRDSNFSSEVRNKLGVGQRSLSKSLWGLKRFSSLAGGGGSGDAITLASGTGAVSSASEFSGCPAGYDDTSTSLRCKSRWSTG